MPTGSLKPATIRQMLKTHGDRRYFIFIAGNADTFRLASSQLCAKRHTNNRIYPQDHKGLFGDKFAADIDGIVASRPLSEALEKLDDEDYLDSAAEGLHKSEDLPKTKIASDLRADLSSQFSEAIPAASNILQASDARAEVDSASTLARYYDEKNRDPIPHDEHEVKCFRLDDESTGKRVESALAVSGGCITALFKTGDEEGNMALVIVVQTGALKSVDKVLKNKAQEARNEAKGTYVDLIKNMEFRPPEGTAAATGTPFSLENVSELEVFRQANRLLVTDPNGDTHYPSDFGLAADATAPTTLESLLGCLSADGVSDDGILPSWLPVWLQASQAGQGLPHVVKGSGKLEGVTVHATTQKMDADMKKPAKQGPGSYRVHKVADKKINYKALDGTFQLGVVATQGEPPVRYELTRAAETLEIYPAQKRNGDKLFSMIKSMMASPPNPLSGQFFSSCECLILVPGMNSLEEQTKARLRLAGLFFDGEENDSESQWRPRVGVYKAVDGNENKAKREELQKRIKSQPNTLFLAIQDECHYGLTLGGHVNRYLEVFSAGAEHPVNNVVRICVTATADSLYILPTTTPEAKRAFKEAGHTFKDDAGGYELPVHVWDSGSGAEREEASMIKWDTSDTSDRPLYYGEKVRTCVVRPLTVG